MKIWTFLITHLKLSIVLSKNYWQKTAWPAEIFGLNGPAQSTQICGPERPGPIFQAWDLQPCYVRLKFPAEIKNQSKINVHAYSSLPITGPWNHLNFISDNYTSHHPQEDFLPWYEFLSSWQLLRIQSPFLSHSEIQFPALGQLRVPSLPVDHQVEYWSKPNLTH